MSFILFGKGSVAGGWLGLVLAKPRDDGILSAVKRRQFKDTANEHCIRLQHDCTHFHHHTLYLLKGQLDKMGIKVQPTWNPSLPRCLACLCCKR